MIQWITRHPHLFVGIATWVFNNVATVLISSLPAPTKSSSAAYVYWFKVGNTIIGNIARAHSTDLELSPNWEDAVSKHLATLSSANGSTATIPPSETRS